MTHNYWLTTFTIETWDEFLDHGGDIAGYGEERWTSVRNMEQGDYLLCYLMRISRFVGLLEVAGEPFFDRQQIWSSRTFPSRVPVRTLLTLKPEQGIPVKEMLEELTIFHNLANLKWWSSRFTVSPLRWNEQDGNTVVSALQDAKRGSD
jgi:hypothetical protein